MRVRLEEGGVSAIVATSFQKISLTVIVTRIEIREVGDGGEGRGHTGRFS